jgi:uncharacterized protein
MSWLPNPESGTTSLITGASSGIGAAIARDLAARGYGVTLVARREERLQALARELAGAHAVRAEVVTCDLADAEARIALADQVQGLGLRVDVLVQSAGLGSYGPFIGLDLRREIEQVRVMCEAVVELCGAFVPAMVARGSGGVVIVSSGLGLQPGARYATYGATKAFCIAFGESLHVELRRSGVAVSNVCPGPVDTEYFSVNGPHPAQRVFPRPMWSSAEAVAAAAIDGLERNRRVVIPGTPMRALMATGRLAPRAVQLRVMDRFFRAPGERRESARSVQKV